MNSQSALTWFEIAATDLDRADQFYAAVLNKPLKREQFGPTELRVFSYDQPGVGGCLIKAPAYQPAANGTVVYLSIEDSMQSALQRTTQAGGQIALGRTELPPGMGCYAHIIDTEGNRIGLHAAN